MANNTDTKTEYNLMAPELLKVRTCVKGSPFVKANRIYLPHPSSVDKTSELQQERYRQYTAGAEFSEFTKTTLASLLGKMKIGDTDITLPAKLEYLRDDSDGDLLSLKGLAESCASNVLQVKWHLLVADYKGLTGVDLENVSISDKEKANPRATINQYSRENVINWGFNRINGRMQLIYLLLREIGETLDIETGYATEVKSYLKLAIDDIGYYQQKLTETSEGGIQEGEKYYVTINGAPLQFIPAEIVSDSEITKGVMPLEAGFISAIADLALYRYRVSATYKESMEGLKPTLNVMGVSTEDWKDFKTINEREYMGMGVLMANIWPSPETKIELVESNQSLEPFVTYFEANAKMVRAIGGVFNSDAAVARTATEVINDSTTSTDTLDPLDNSLESSLATMITYCGMFEGMYQPEDLQAAKDDIVISMPREFAISKLSPEEVKALLEVFNNGLLPKDEFLKILSQGGWTISSAEELINSVEIGGLM